MPESNPLSAEQQQQVADAGGQATRILAATKVATFNGWTLGVFAALSLLFAFQSLTAFIMGLGLGWIAWNEFKGRARLRAFDATAPAFLGKNQLALLSLISTCALASIYRTLTSPIPDLAAIEDLIGPVGDLLTSLTITVYVVLVVLTVILQGLNARYYFARRQTIEAYLANTPDWIVQLQRRIGV